MSDMQYRPWHVVEFWKKAYLTALKTNTPNSAEDIAYAAMRHYTNLCNKTLVTEIPNKHE